MDNQKQRWEEYYRSLKGITIDKWLEEYSSLFSKDSTVLDLGSGNGANIPFMLSKTDNVFALDYAESAINIIKNKYQIEAITADMRMTLPYNDQSFEIIICDLSLHYFSESETKSIIEEIRRIMKSRGVLLARLNSINDIKHGAQKGKEIEKGYFEYDGRRKRFFDKEMIQRFFSKYFEIEYLEEKRTGKYLEEKVLWEMKAVKNLTTAST
jgi:ubiquinone/menaquinone biosynthesis C-methylase UbiE